MNLNKALLLPFFFAGLSLAACSGSKNRIICTVNCAGGNANVTVTLFDAPPSQADLVNFNVPIIGITLTPQSGTPVVLLNTQTTFELTRLQSDSTAVGTFQVPAGTYTSIAVTLGSAFGVFANSSNSTIGTCNAKSVCPLAAGAPGTINVTLSPALALAGNQNVGLGLEFNFNNAITTSGGISIDLGQPNVLSVVTLPRTGQASNTLDTIEAFTGIVKTVSGTTITVRSDSGATLTATAGTGTTFNAPPDGSTACATFNLACVAVGQTLSVDATVALDGTLSLTNVDFLDLPAVDEVEGTIFLTTTPGTYLLVVSDKTLVSGDAILQPVSSGTRLNLTLDQTSTPTFFIETSNLPVFTLTGFSSPADILSGQRVLARVKPGSVTQGTLVTFVANRLILRFSRLTGSVVTVAGTDFTIQNLPSYLPFITAPQVRTFIPQTILDNVTGGTLGNLTNGDSVSIRALLLNPLTAQPPMLAAKVRKH